MKKLLWQFSGLIVITFCLSAVAPGQSGAATLSGTVVDENGAVVADAAIKITDAARAFEWQTTTNDEGFFTFVQLQPTTYAVKAERSGFSAAELKDVVLNVGDRRSLQIVLRAGDVSATVAVNGEASSVDESPAVATTIDPSFWKICRLTDARFNR